MAVRAAELGRYRTGRSGWIYDGPLRSSSRGEADLAAGAIHNRSRWLKKSTFE